MWMKLESATGYSRKEFLDAYDVDFRYINGPVYVGPELPEGCDIWGVRRVQVSVAVCDGVETYSELAWSPLGAAETVEDIEHYAHWPSADWFDYSDIERQCDAVLAEDRVVVFMGDRLNRVAQLKPAMYLRGMENILTDLRLHESLAQAIFSRIRSFYKTYLERILQASRGKIDIVLMGDDFGTQNGLLLSPAMWCRYLKQGFREYIEIAKSHGARVMHHTCGAVRELIPQMMECGLDILQSLQPEAAGMNLRDLLRDFGGRLCFHGGISIQQTMPFATPAEIQHEVEQIAEAAKHYGGYIFCTAHNIQADTPVDNVTALMEAYHEFGRLSP